MGTACGASTNYGCLLNVYGELNPWKPSWWWRTHVETFAHLLSETEREKNKSAVASIYMVWGEQDGTNSDTLHKPFSFVSAPPSSCASVAASPSGTTAQPVWPRNSRMLKCECIRKFILDFLQPQSVMENSKSKGLRTVPRSDLLAGAPWVRIETG